MFHELCGNSTLHNVAIVTNMWGEVTQEVGEAREYELATEENAVYIYQREIFMNEQFLLFPRYQQKLFRAE
jgi:RecA-family ATPase